MTDHRPDPTVEDFDGAPGFHITDDEVATWALRVMRDAEAELDRLERNYRAELRFLAEQHDKARSPHVRTVDFMRAHLMDYRERVEEQRPELRRKRTPYRLPTGVLSRRRTPPALVVTDEDALIGWALGNRPDLLNITPRRADVKAAVVEGPEGTLVVKDTGEAVPGVTLTREDRVEVKPDRLPVEGGGSDD